MSPEFKNIAFDENYSDRFMGGKARQGHMIVYVAPKGSRDEEWIMEAYYRGAEIIYSRDFDVPNFIDRNNLPIKWVKE